MEIEIPKGYKAEWVNGVLTLVQDKKEDLRPVTERVKTFEDAVVELGESHPLVLQYKFNFSDEAGWADSEYAREFEAYLKLRIITEALNEGWKPQFIGNEYKYSPWYDFYTEVDWRDLSEDVKRECGVLLDGSAVSGRYAGIICSYAGYAPSWTATCIGFNLCYKTHELAKYSGKQFASLWLDFCCLQNTERKPYIKIIEQF